MITVDELTGADVDELTVLRAAAEQSEEDLAELAAAFLAALRKMSDERRRRVLRDAIREFGHDLVMHGGAVQPRQGNAGVDTGERSHPGLIATTPHEETRPTCAKR